jgi:hypothetical protein
MKKQNEYFEKVVTWKDKPDFYLTLCGIFLMLLGFSNILILPNKITYFSGVIFFCNIVGFIFIGVLLIIYSLGEGRKVMWRKVK